MARTNGAMNATAAELLDVQPDDQILEIGFGPGRLIKLLARRATRGFVAGVDLSDVMVRQATRLNRRLIAKGRVLLQQGSVSTLPFPDGFFTKACAVNSFQFWPTPEDDLREVHRMLRHRAVLLLGLRIKDPTRWFMKNVGCTERQVDEVKRLVSDAGFRNVRVETRQLPRERASYVIGQC